MLYTNYENGLNGLYEQRAWEELLSLASSQINKTPEWLTPYLYSGIALANLGHKTEAIERLRFVEERAAGHPDYSEASKMLNALKSQ